MAELDDALYAYLSTYAGLTALISTRVYPNELPQGTTLPAVVYITISDIKNHTLTGQSKLENPMIQFTAYSLTRATARAVANQIKTALADYHGTLSGLVIQKIELENEMSSIETNSDGTLKVYTNDLEFQVFYEKG